MNFFQVVRKILFANWWWKSEILLLSNTWWSHRFLYFVRRKIISNDAFLRRWKIISKIWKIAWIKFFQKFRLLRKIWILWKILWRVFLNLIPILPSNIWRFFLPSCFRSRWRQVFLEWILRSEILIIYWFGERWLQLHLPHWVSCIFSL